MCGITGIINTNGEPVDISLLKRMTDSIAHRGPDGEGHWVEGNIGLGHRRLAIIDLSPAGFQPMMSSDHRFVLVYNGEIYNYSELRADLELEGVWFRSRSDSEVVLYALAQWGTKALLRFNGMFALSLWDRKNRTLLLARDRYGIKPLYYAQQGSSFAFGSEQKAILAQPQFRRNLNKPALLEYFTFQNIFTDQTLLDDIKLLPPGHYLTFDFSSGHQRRIQYWDYRFNEPEKPARHEEYLEELDRLFRQAVNRQLVSDVELGAYLSGGMDSGSITAIASRSLPNLKSFTVGFDLTTASGMEFGFDERVKAEAMSAQFRQNIMKWFFKAGDMERCLPELAWHLEEPRVGKVIQIITLLLTSKFVKVVLGGVEMNSLADIQLVIGLPLAKILNITLISITFYWQRSGNTELKSMFSPVWNDVKQVWTRDIFRNVFASNDNNLESPEDYINHSLYFEAKTFCMVCLLWKISCRWLMDWKAVYLLWIMI